MLPNVSEIASEPNRAPFPGRLVVGGSGGLVAAGRSDAELIGLCAAFDAHELTQQATYEALAKIVDHDGTDAAAFLHFERMDVLVDEMELLHAVTPAGIVARACSRAVHAGHGHYSSDYKDGTAGPLLQLLLQDAAALGGRTLA